MINDTDLHILGHEQLGIINHIKCITLLYMTLTYLPFTLLGNDGSNRLFPDWSFEIIPAVENKTLLGNTTTSHTPSLELIIYHIFKEYTSRT